MVVDISVKQQPYKKKELAYLPDTVLSMEKSPAPVEVGDIVSPSAQAEMFAHGIPPDQHLHVAACHIPEIFNSFPAVYVPGLLGAMLKYSPVAIQAPNGSFEEMRNMNFNGLTPWELYTTKLLDKLRAPHAY